MSSTDERHKSSLLIGADNNQPTCTNYYRLYN